MIRHIVLIRFQPSADAMALLAPLAMLTQKLGFTAHWGRSESPEQIERGYMHGFTADFTSWDALASYAADPDHQAFGAGLVANAVDGIDGILVFDLAFGGDPSLS
jgi:hypothetical protein